MSIQSTLTYADIADFITEEYPKDAASPSVAHILRLCNQALKTISSKVGGFNLVWTGNASSGEGYIQSNPDGSKVYGFYRPVDLINIINVKYDGEILTRETQQSLDEIDPYWEASDAVTGIPDSYCVYGPLLKLDKPISTADVSKLKIQGIAHLPPMAIAETSATTPLRFLPMEYQIAPAYYALSMLRADDDAGMQRRQQYSALWQEALNGIIENTKAVDLEPYNGD